MYMPHFNFYGTRPQYGEFNNGTPSSPPPRSSYRDIHPSDQANTSSSSGIWRPFPRNDGLSCDDSNNGQPQLQQRQQQEIEAISGGYCHLSYYGEVVDKKYLPDMINFANGGQSSSNDEPINLKLYPQSNPKESYQQQRQQSNVGKQTFRRHSSVPSPPLDYHDSRVTFPGETLDQVSRVNEVEQNARGPIYHQNNERSGADFRWQQKRLAANGGEEDGIFTTRSQNDRTSQEVGNRNNFRNDQSPCSSPCSFKNAVSSLPEKQEEVNQTVALSGSSSWTRQTFQGWSRVASNATVKRKVTLSNNDVYDDHGTKLMKRLNRFGGPTEKTRLVSLDEIIEMQQSKNKPAKLMRESPSGPIHAISTWKSGDGRNVSFAGNSFRQGITGSEVNERFRMTNRYNPYRGEPAVPNRFLKQSNESFARGVPTMSRFQQATRPFLGNSKCRAVWRKSPVVIDGSNVAFTFGDGLHFDCRGIQICVEYFLNLGWDDVTVVVPRDRLAPGASKNGKCLQDLNRRKMLVANYEGRFSGDDRLFLLYAAFDKGAHIVSNLNFGDIETRNSKFRLRSWNRVLSYHFSPPNNPKRIYFPDLDG